MALEEHIETLSFDTEGGAIGQYILVESSTSLARTCKVAPAGSNKLLGATLIATSAAGRATAVARGGIVKVKAGAAVAVGDRVTSDSQGRAVTSSAGGCGIAVSAAAAAGEIIEVCWGAVGVPA